MANVTIEEQILTMTTVAANRVISRMQLEHGYGGRFNIHTRVAAEMDALVMMMVGFLAADHLETVNITYPQDWWEAVKQRFAPSWFLKRYPVRETHHVVNLEAVYPKFPLPEKFGPYIRVQRHTHEARGPELES